MFVEEGCREMQWAESQLALRYNKIKQAGTEAGLTVRTYQKMGQWAVKRSVRTQHDIEQLGPSRT
jgi:hypothetical protein